MVLTVPAFDLDGALQPGPLILAGFVLLLTFFGYWAQEERPYPGFKLVGKEPGEWGNKKAKERFVKSAITILKRGMEEVSALGSSSKLPPGSAIGIFVFADSVGCQCHGKVFQVIGRNGPLIILPASFADEIRNNENLSLTGFGERVCDYHT